MGRRMYEIGLWPATCDWINEDTSASVASISRRSCIILTSIIVGFLLWIWMAAQPSAILVFTTIEVTVANKADSIQQCLSAYDGRSLWTLNLTHFVEPPCQNILDGYDLPDDEDNGTWTPAGYFDEENAIALVNDCNELKNRATFPHEPHSKEEAEYPLAYVITARENSPQTLRFFRSIYWPQNTYCFALAPDSTNSYRKFVYSLAKCFSGNVFVKGSLEHTVQHKDQYAFLRHTVECLGALVEQTTRPWNYVQIVSALDFPLKTNLELVRILPLLNGSNDCILKEEGDDEYSEVDTVYESTKTVAPAGLVLYRGSIESTLSFPFVEYVVRNETSKRLLHWLNGTTSPELYYTSTLVHNIFLGHPGTFPGMCLHYYSTEGQQKSTISYARVWDEDVVGRMHCKELVGFYRGTLRRTCNAGIADVAWYIEQPHLMAQRFDSDYEPAALYCLEKWHWRKVCERTYEITETVYMQLPASRYANASNREEFLC